MPLLAPSWRCMETNHCRMPGCTLSRGGRGHVELPDPLGHLDIVQKNPVAERRRQQPDAGPLRQLAQLFAVIEIAVGLDRLQRKGTIHGPALQVQQAKAGRDPSRDGALAGAGGPSMATTRGGFGCSVMLPVFSWPVCPRGSWACRVCLRALPALDQGLAEGA